MHSQVWNAMIDNWVTIDHRCNVNFQLHTRFYSLFAMTPVRRSGRIQNKNPKADFTLVLIFSKNSKCGSPLTCKTSVACFCCDTNLHFGNLTRSDAFLSLRECKWGIQLQVELSPHFFQDSLKTDPFHSPFYCCSCSVLSVEFDSKKVGAEKLLFKCPLCPTRSPLSHRPRALAQLKPFPSFPHLLTPRIRSSKGAARSRVDAGGESSLKLHSSARLLTLTLR